MLVLLASLITAHAGEADLEAGRYALERGREVQASRIAARLLEANPSDLAAHRLYVAAAWNRGQLDALEGQHRAWVQANPTDPVPRVALAGLLGTTHHHHGAWCDEATELLGIGDAPAEVRFWAQVAQRDVAGLCGGDVDAPKVAIRALAGEVDAAARAALLIRIEQGDLDRVALRQLETQLATHPGWLGPASAVLWRAESDDPLLAGARRAAMKAARKALRGNDVVATWAARRCATASGDPDLEVQADERLAALDPLEPTTNNDDPWMRAVRTADRRPTDVEALAALEPLADSIPPTGPVRAAWHERRANRLEGLDRGAEALAERRAAWEADTTTLRRANAYAWTAAERGEQVDHALEVIDAAIAQLREQTWSPGGTSWRAWSAGHADDLSAWLDTRGWLLYRKGDLAAAAVALQQALLAAPGADQHAHLGIVYLDLGEPGAAFEHLCAAMPLELGDAALEALVVGHLGELYRSQGVWHPGGLDGWLADLRRVQEDLDNREAYDESGHPLVGRPFPVDAWSTLSGGQTTLAALDGPLVVDVWATWCGPCVAGMPALGELAARWRDKGVRVVGLSVDDQRRKAEHFFEASAAPAYDLGWIGRGGFEQLSIGAIPALFVLDREHEVVRFVQGGNLDRVEDVLRELVDDG